MKSDRKTIWIFAGGTGGHISPAVSLAHSFLKKNSLVFFFTLPKNISYPSIREIDQEQDVTLVNYPASPIPKNIFSLFRFLKEIRKSFQIFTRARATSVPWALIGMGGYPCFSPLLWARLNSIPYYLCEQNAVLGRITRYFTSRAKAVFLSFPIMNQKAPGKNFIFSGNPIRKELTLQKSEIPKASSSVKKILLTGGSQGALDINKLYLAMIRDPFFKKIRFILAAGKEHYKSVSESARPEDQITGFIEDMSSTLKKVDFMIARAGSGTLFEILSCRKPAVLLPYPYAIYDHQRKNALYLERENLARVVDIRPFQAGQALSTVREILSDGTVDSLRKNLLTHKIPLDAHESIPNYILK